MPPVYKLLMFIIYSVAFSLTLLLIMGECSTPNMINMMHLVTVACSNPLHPLGAVNELELSG